MAQSIPISDLDKKTGNIKESDIFLLSEKQAENIYVSKKVEYPTLSASIYNNIRPYITNVLSDIIITDDWETPQNRSMIKTYPCATISQIYSTITNDFPKKLDKTTTNKQSVESQVEFKKKISCPTPSENDADNSVVTIGFLKNYCRFVLKEEHKEEDGSMTHYRIYSDGWCEQCGKTKITATNYQLCTLPIPFKDTNYSAVVTQVGNGNDNIGIFINGNKYKLTESSFYVRHNSNKGYHICWMASGYVDITQL